MPCRKRTAREMEQESPDLSSSDLDEICSNGDVIFLFPKASISQSINSMKLLVSSTILTMASPVFTTLLGPHFREGQVPRDPSNPLEIPLPEDEPQAMSDLLRILHLVNVPELASANDSGRILAFAVAADKWACVEALRLQSQGILLGSLRALPMIPARSIVHNKSQGSNARAAAELASAAYLLKQYSSFSALTKRLLLEYTGSFLQLSKKADHDILPMQYYFILEERRGAARQRISDGLEKLAMLCPYCHNLITFTASPAYKTHLASKYEKQHVMQSRPPWQDSGSSLREALECVRKLKPFPRTNLHEECGNCSQAPAIGRDEYERVAHDVDLFCGGLSIDCIEAECTSFTRSMFRCAEFEDHRHSDL